MVIEQLFERVRDLFEHVYLTDSEDMSSDDYYLKKFPDVGGLTDDEIECFAASHLSRVDYEEKDYHLVIKNLKRLRDFHRGSVH